MMAGLEPGEPYSRTIGAAEIFKYIFNVDTVDHVLTRLMTDGIRLDEGMRVGKSIVFAYNHKHAQLIAERFAALYPDLGPRLLPGNRQLREICLGPHRPVCRPRRSCPR